MCFVNVKFFGGIWLFVFEFVLFFFRGIVVDVVERNFVLRLYCVFDLSWDVVDGFVVGNLKMNFYVRVVWDGWRIVCVVWKEYFEYVVIVFGYLFVIFVEILIVEVVVKVCG